MKLIIEVEGDEAQTLVEMLAGGKRVDVHVAEVSAELAEELVAQGKEAATKPKRKRRTKKEMEEARKATEVEKPEPIPAEKRRGLTAKEAFAWAVEQKQNVIDQVLEIMGELGATKFSELTEETAPIFAARVSELRDAA